MCLSLYFGVGLPGGDHCWGYEGVCGRRGADQTGWCFVRRDRPRGDKASHNMTNACYSTGLLQCVICLVVVVVVVVLEGPLAVFTTAMAANCAT